MPRPIRAAIALTAALLAAPVAWAQDGADAALPQLPIVGAPIPGGMGFQPASSSIARETFWLDGMMSWIMLAIVVLVTAALIFCIVVYNRRAHPTPGRFTHNSPLEITWTLVPIVILVFIGAFSLPILFDQQEIPEADVTIKATGHQWYWSYAYPDQDFEFDSFMLAAEDLPKYGYDPSLYKLATDTAMVVPVGKVIVVQDTGADVTHSWTVPAFGVKQDAVPGRLGQLWFRADKEGVYFGQCSFLCGKDHAFMPIQVKVVSQEAYDAWLTSAKAEYASISGAPRAVETAEK